MKWSALSLQAAWPTYAAEWETLNAVGFGDHPLLSIDFVGPLVECFASADDRLLVCSDSSGPQAMMMLSPGALKWQSFLPSQAPIAPNLLANAGAIEHLWPALGVFVQVLDLMRQDPALSVGAPGGPRLDQVPYVRTINVAIADSFDSYWGTRAKSLQQDIRNKFNRVQTDRGSHQLVVHESWPGISEALDRYAELESSGWKGGSGTALQIGGAQHNFYSAVLERFARRGAASIFELYVGQELAASEIVIRGGSMAVLLKTTHRASLGRYAPGYLLDHLLLKHEFDLGRVSVVEFYTDANEQKLRWSTGQRVIQHCRHYKWQLSRHATAALRRLRARQMKPTAEAQGKQ